MKDYKKTTIKDWTNTPLIVGWKNVSIIVFGLFVWYQIIQFFAS